jgi:hypothetical protein
MKRILISSMLLLAIATNVNAQESAAKTKIDEISLRTGLITKFTEYNLSPLKTSYGTSETRIKKITSNGQTSYFMQLEKKASLGSNVTYTASIAYDDLVKALNAMKTLMTEVDADAASKPDYLENKYITIDGLQVGYYVDNKGKVSWYLKPGAGQETLYVKDPNIIVDSFTQAKNKIEELKG